MIKTIAERKKDYFAFISYKSEDVEWAIWLQHELEHYHLPASFNGRSDVRQDLRPVFRDINELSAGNLPKQIKQALEHSQNLIVICSPQAAKSTWVNQEVESFITSGRVDRIFPFIVEGSSPSEFFPPALFGLPKDEERLGGDVGKNGRDVAFVKIVAGMLGVSFDALWNRYEKEKAEEERKIKEQRDNLLKMRSRMMAEKSRLTSQTDGYIAQLLALEALPKDLANLDRPYVPEAEYALRIAVNAHTFVIKHNASLVAVSPDGQQIATESDNNEILLWNRQSGVVEHALKGHTGRVYKVLYSPNGNHIISTARDGCINIWDPNTGKLIRSIQETKVKDEIAHKIVKCPRNVDTTSLKSQTKLDNFMSFFNSDSQEKKTATSPRHDMGTYDFMFSPVTIPKTEIKTEPHYSTDVSLSADGNMLASVGPSRYVLIWSIESGELLSVFESPQWPNEVVSISPSGKKLFVASGFITSQHYGTVWDIPNKKLLFSVEVDSLGVSSAVFSEDEDDILIACSNSVKILDSVTGEIEDTIKMSQRSPKCAYYSSDYLEVVTASEKSIDLWDLDTLELNRTLGFHIGEINSIAVSSGSKTVVSCSEDGIVKIWDCNDSNCLSEERCMNKNSEVSIDKSKIKCNLDTELLDDICCVDYSPDGQYMLTGISHETIIIWNVQTEAQVYSIEADYFNNAYFSDNGKQIVAVTENYTRRWDFLPLQYLINQTRERYRDRPLTPIEKKTYYLDE